MPEKDVNEVDVRRANIKLAVSVFLRTVLVAVLSIFIYMSLSVIVSGVSTKNIGYEEYKKDANGSWTRVGVYTNITTNATTAATTSAATATTAPSGGQAAASGTSRPASTTAVSTGTTEEVRQQAIRSEVPKGAALFLDILSEVLMLCLLAALPYSIVWAQGDRDKNKVQFGHMQEDKLRGLKIGLMAGIPSYIGYILLLLSKLNVLLPGYFYAYRLLNMPFLPILNRLAGTDITSTAQISWPAILAMLMVVVFVPLVCTIGYALGYKQISLSERFIYVNPNGKKKRRR